MNNKNKRQKNLISCGKKNKKKTFMLYDKCTSCDARWSPFFFVLTSKREEFYWGKKKNKNQRVKEINNTY